MQGCPLSLILYIPTASTATCLARLWRPQNLPRLGFSNLAEHAWPGRRTLIFTCPFQFHLLVSVLSTIWILPVASTLLGGTPCPVLLSKAWHSVPEPQPEDRALLLAGCLPSDCLFLDGLLPCCFRWLSGAQTKLSQSVLFFCTAVDQDMPPLILTEEMSRILSKD